MKWSFLALAPLAGFLAHPVLAPEPPTGIEFVFADATAFPCSSYGSLEIDGLERPLSTRARLDPEQRRLQLALPPGLYALRHVPSPDSACPSMVVRDQSVVIVAPRSVARVNIHFASHTGSTSPPACKPCVARDDGLAAGRKCLRASCV